MGIRKFTIIVRPMHLLFEMFIHIKGKVRVMVKTMSSVWRANRYFTKVSVFSVVKFS